MALCVVRVFSRSQYCNPRGRTRGLFAVKVKHFVEVLQAERDGGVSVKPFVQPVLAKAKWRCKTRKRTEP
ncbi:hypothetical protein EV649_6250 [Kribbella sp. VKM Ac-2569]|nr:hypothetical protein EV649_6250 [Kribbella sp. VKM Ac-2569]